MSSEEKTNLIITVTVLVVIIAFYIITFVGPEISFLASGEEYDREDVKEKIQEHLYNKYGKEFAVYRIGRRSSGDSSFYQARIYPKEIRGTNKYNDDYYYGEASLGVEDGRLGGVGDSYELVNLKLDIEDYLSPKVKDIFGKRVLMKIEAHYKRREPGNETFWGYKVESFKKAQKLIAEDPGNRMIELDLDVYVFDRIADDEEKEQRREDIFEFVQYLQEEGLFEYLEMRVIFVDERVLADSYDEFERKIDSSHKVPKYIEEEDKTVELPPKELREEMSKKLQAEIDEMSEEELLASMNEIRKDELNYDDIGQWNSQYHSLVYSEGMLKERYGHDSDYERIRNYDDIGDIVMSGNLEYIYK